MESTAFRKRFTCADIKLFLTDVSLANTNIEHRNGDEAHTTELRSSTDSLQAAGAAKATQVQYGIARLKIANV